MRETLKALTDDLDAFGAAMESDFIAKVNEAEAAQERLSVAAEQAARNIHDSFAEFLFEAFDDGLKDSLRNFVDFLRQISAQVAASRISDWLTNATAASSGSGFSSSSTPCRMCWSVMRASPVNR